MKKTLSFVLVLALVLGSFSTAFAGTTAVTTAATTAAKATVAPDVQGTTYEAPVTVLTALGVVSGYEDGNYKPANNVTRAEFAKLIVAELGLEGNAQASKSTFKDMSGYGWADGYVGYAASLGIIKGYGDGSFKPANNVTHDEALTMIVRALGYTSDCKEMNGTWPAIYVQKARVLGITDDVKTGGAVAANRGDVATYLYNTLTCNMGYADDKGVFQEKKDKDGLAIKVASSLDAEESKDYKVITNSDADNALVNIRNYVGAYAKVFTLTKGKNDGDIIAISDTKSDFISGEYKAGDKILKAADGTEYTLDDVVTSVAGTSKEIAKGTAAKEFVNGKIAGSTGNTILNTGATALDPAKTGKIVTIAADLSGKTVKGIYSVSIWNQIVDEKVDADDIATIKANKTLLGKKFIKDDNDKDIDLTSFSLLGVKSLDDIKAGNVVYVYANSDDEITRIAVGTETAKGAVTAIKESAADATVKDTKVTIGGKTYLFAGEKLANNGLSNDFAAGDVDVDDEINVYLDAYGYMYDYDAISGKADNYAILLENGTGATGTIGTDKREVKLFLADGTDKTFKVDDDLFKDGTDLVPGVTVKGGWDPKLTAGAIVKYGLDKDGMIDSLENLGYDNVAVKGYKTETSTSNSAIDITETGYYNNMQIRPNAVIFSFEKKASGASFELRSDEDNYGVTTLEKVKKTKDVAASYVLDDNKISAMLMYDFNGADETYGVVTEATKSTGTSDYKAKIFVDGVEKEYGLSSSGTYSKAKNLTSFNGKGLQKIEFNASGEVKDLVPAWTDSVVSGGDTYATASAVIATGKTSTYDNNTFVASQGSISYVKDSSKTTGADNTATTIQVMSTAKAYKYDKGDFKVGTLSDLKALPAGSEVWFYDTKDDSNNGLMTVVLYKRADSGTSATTPGTTLTTDGTLAYASATAKEIQIGTKVYPVAGTAVGVLAELQSGGKLFNDTTGMPIAGASVAVSVNVVDGKVIGFGNIVITVSDADQLTKALAVTGVNQIIFAKSIDAAANITISKLVDINFGAYTLDMKGFALTVQTAASGTMTLSGTAATSITGNLTVDTPNATFNNGVKASGTITINGVSANTWNENAKGNTLDWNVSGAALKLNDTVTKVTMNKAGTVTGAAKATEIVIKADGIKLDANPTTLTNTDGHAVTVGSASKTAKELALDTAKAAAATLNSADFTADSWARVTTALAKAEGTDAEKTDKTTAITNAIAKTDALNTANTTSLVYAGAASYKVADTALTTALNGKAEGYFTPASWAAKVAAVAMTTNTNAEVVAKTNALLAAAAGMTAAADIKDLAITVNAATAAISGNTAKADGVLQYLVVAGTMQAKIDAWNVNTTVATVTADLGAATSATVPTLTKANDDTKYLVVVEIKDGKVVSAGQVLITLN